MLFYDKENRTISDGNTGTTDDILPVKDQYVVLEKKLTGVLYEPVIRNEKSKIGVVIIHSDSDYSSFSMCRGLAKKGYITFGGKVKNAALPLDAKLTDVHTAVSFLKAYPGIEKVILMGHSGGATLMSAYKAIAENGAGIFQGREMLYPCQVEEPLEDADGLMLIDSNWGNGATTLFSMDPAVMEEGNGKKVNPMLDIYAAKNGYDPAGAHYSKDFIKAYLTAQGKRNNQIVRKALERLEVLKKGEGNYVDDEPFIVSGGAQTAMCNKLFPQDLNLFSRTKEERKLLHADGSESVEIVHSVRPAASFENMTPVNREGTLVTTVKSFLSERSVLADESYEVTEDGVSGIAWNRVYNCPPGNVRFIRAPLLCMGMTGGYEYLAAEEIYENAASEDKDLAFVEGADHLFRAIDKKYGEPEKILYGYIDRWLSKPGRFMI